ncbi:MAG TPA: hypothetical protein VFR24_20435, partial [Candidatus Angelobacter sp.]|nr:hypothetical protein [Candidatus Angelobacter sp.]
MRKMLHAANEVSLGLTAGASFLGAPLRQRVIPVIYSLLEMPVSLANSGVVYQALKKCGIGLVSALP